MLTPSKLLVPPIGPHILMYMGPPGPQSLILLKCMDLTSATLYDCIPSAQASHSVGDNNHFWYDISSDKEAHRMGKVTKISKGIINFM